MASGTVRNPVCGWYLVNQVSVPIQVDENGIVQTASTAPHPARRETYTGTAPTVDLILEDVACGGTLEIFVYVDKSCGVSLAGSLDGTNWRDAFFRKVPANTTLYRAFVAAMPYYRLRVAEDFAGTNKEVALALF